MRYLLFCLVAAVSVLILWTPPAIAGPVTVQVTGRVTGSDFATIGVDSLVTGYYSYDDATPNSYFDDSHGWYHPATFSLSFVDGSTISSSEAEIWVNNNSGGIGTVDEFSVKFQPYAPFEPSPNTLTGAFAGLDVFFGARLYRNDPTGAAWDSVALPDPESILSLLPNDGSGLSLIATPLSLPPEYSLDFEVTGLSVVPAIPVPGAAFLVALGLISMNWRLRKRRTV